VTSEERDFFRLLVEKVSGIGPKLALTILSRLSLPVLRDAIVRSDVTLLSQCPGIGKKTAERLVVELRDKLGADLGTTSTNTTASSSAQPSAVSDAVAALIALGNKAADADKFVRAAVLKLGSSATAD
jgi:Holliday junction DNA helicase RuvA